MTTTTVLVTNVHDTPSLLSVDPSAVRIFVDKVKSLHATHYVCKPDLWIVNNKDKHQLACQLRGKTIISKMEEFDSILVNTEILIQMMDQ